MHIHNLPDLCVLEIFDRVPIADLFLYVARTCRRWHQLVKPSALARREELQLVISNEINSSDFDSVSNIKYMHWIVGQNAPEPFLTKLFHLVESSFPSLSSLSINYLIRMHRNITHEGLLQLQNPRPFLDMLVNLGQRLVKLDFRATRTSGFPEWGPELCHQINQCMPNLRELELHIERAGPLSIIKQLSHFKLKYYCNEIEELEHVVLQYLKEDCERLMCCELTGNIILFNHWLKVNSNVTKKITRKDMFGDFDYNTLQQLTARFPSLTWLFVITESDFDNDDHDISVVQVFSCLPRLNQLRTLELHLDHYYIGLHYDLSSLAQLQLPTVREIIWKCNLDNHRQLHELFNFSYLFPNIQSVRIDYPNSDECSLCNDPEGNAWQSCIQAMCDCFSDSNHPHLKYVLIESPLMLIEAEWKLKH